MMLIDTHAHLFADVFQNDIEEVVSRARAAGVERCCFPISTRPPLMIFKQL